jgi:hypothetical protein
MISRFGLRFTHGLAPLQWYPAVASGYTTLHQLVTGNRGEALARARLVDSALCNDTPRDEGREQHFRAEDQSIWRGRSIVDGRPSVVQTSRQPRDMDHPTTRLFYRLNKEANRYFATT